ncbi:MAG: TlyA family RNA methyltransferase [Candidatus Bipolaricaulota bacterium]|nr:TlyA family RNA methyltransferase [Candidatus Bipolaricaulota bacterium]MDW8126605.1 TlyA family RNA methyltransferase [Candidatus Bipolaricaulota bacterium]
MKEDHKRLDLLLVDRGLAPSRAKAQALILAGQVRVNGVLMDKPATLVSRHSHLEVLAPPKYVSRGGEKLEVALRAFAINPAGKICLDIGASTGGFTDCLLQHGAARVYAVDVGRGQLHWKLRQDPRVVVKEGLNARYLRFEDIGEEVDLVTIDVSFISLRLILPQLPGIVRPDGVVVPLVKPQFEAGREKVKGGVIRDPQTHREVLEKLREFVQLNLNWSVLDAIPSPLLGPKGNREFFLCIVPKAGTSNEFDWKKLGL